MLGARHPANRQDRNWHSEIPRGVAQHFAGLRHRLGQDAAWLHVTIDDRAARLINARRIEPAVNSQLDLLRQEIEGRADAGIAPLAGGDLVHLGEVGIEIPQQVAQIPGPAGEQWNKNQSENGDRGQPPFRITW